MINFKALSKLSLILLITLSVSAFADDKINWSGPYMGIKAGYSQYENKGSGEYSDDTFDTPNNLANIWNDVSKKKKITIKPLVDLRQGITGRKID